MERRADYFYFTDGELDTLDLANMANPIHIDDIDIMELDSQTRRLEEQLEGIMAADDDEALQSERGYIVASGNLLQRRKAAVRQLTALWLDTTLS